MQPPTESYRGPLATTLAELTSPTRSQRENNEDDAGCVLCGVQRTRRINVKMMYHPPKLGRNSMRHVVSASLFVLCVRAGAAGVRSARGQAGAHGQGSVPHSGLFQRLPDLCLNVNIPPGRNTGYHIHYADSVSGEPDAGLADEPELRLVRSERAGYGRRRCTRPCDVYECDQEWSAHAQGDQCRADAVPQHLLHSERIADRPEPRCRTARVFAGYTQIMDNARLRAWRVVSETRRGDRDRSRKRHRVSGSTSTAAYWPKWCPDRPIVAWLRTKAISSGRMPGRQGR